MPEKMYVYANLMQIRSGALDFAINFQMFDVEGKVVSEYEVHLSPQAAKLFATALSHQVKEYEARFGELPELYTEKEKQQGEINSKQLQ
jgi:hypothetical protein